MDLNLRQARAFVAVAEGGSFTRAAAALHLSQPALTVQIRNLEQTLGNRLLDRNNRGVALTRAGRELLPMLQKTLHSAERVLHGAREWAAPEGGTVRLAVLPSFSSGLLPDVIRRWRQTRPGLQFIVKDAVASDVNALVAREDVDIGLTGGDVDASELDVVLRVRDRLHLVFPAGHALGAKARINARDLCQVPLVLTARGTSVRAVVDGAFERLGRSPLVSCEPTYMMTAVAMVRAGLGLTILPGSAREIRAEPELRSRPIEDARFVRPVSLVKKRGRSLPAASAAFLAAFKAALEEGTPSLLERARPG